MAYEFLGEYYAGLGDFTNAIINFTKAIELNPSNYKAYFYRAAALDKHKNHKKAIEDYSKALKLNPYFIKAYW